MAALNSPPLERAILFINHKKEHAQGLAEEIRDELGRRNIKSDFFSFDKKPDFTTEAGYNIAFSLGGDGTVL
jgi:NAD kinase